MNRYPNQAGWHYFYFPNSFLPQQDGTHFYEMIILRRKGNLYFFSNSVAWCLGHPEPHEAIQQHVPKKKLLTFDSVGGYFLDEDAVFELAAKSDPNVAQAFLQWFEGYLQNDS